MKFSDQQFRCATTLASEVESGASSAAKVIEHFKGRISKFNSTLNALITESDQTEKEGEKSLKTHSKGPLAGVPVVVKDNIAVKGWRLSCGSKILGKYVSPFDAHVVQRLRSAGAVIIGKTNLDEFAMGSSNESSCFGPTKNPWALDRVPGGSSGGSAAAVCAGLAPIALGSDTGGSIRQPAAFCGIVGFKPTYGRVSRYGLVAYGSSLDQIGPLTNSVKDAALVFDVISGHDPRDSMSVVGPAGNAREAIARQKDLSKIKIGLISELMGDGVQPDVRSSVNEALTILKGLGSQIESVNVPSLKHSVAAYYILATAEASANLARFDGIRYGVRIESPGANLQDVYKKSRSQGFGREVKKRIMLGTFVLSSGYYDAYYAKAMALRKIITSELDLLFSKYDFLVSPTVPTTAYKIGEKIDDPLAMYLGDICTISANLAGLPALSIPSGFDGLGLPIGIQLMAARYNDEMLFATGNLFEAARGSLIRQPAGIG